MQGRQERTFRWDWLCPVPLVGLVGQDSYVPDWSMKDGLLRLVRDIRVLIMPRAVTIKVRYKVEERAGSLLSRKKRLQISVRRAIYKQIQEYGTQEVYTSIELTQGGLSEATQSGWYDG